MNECTCGSVLHVDVGESIISGVYRWYASYHCDKCGESIEVDGCGMEDIPNEIKISIIKKAGEWGLRSSASKTKIKYLMGKILQSANMNLEKEIFFVGTQSQVKWVKNELIERGIKESDLIAQKL